MIISNKFRPTSIIEYPPGNTHLFEEYFFEEYSRGGDISNRVYLPIYWTNYYISKNYGAGDLSDLQSILDQLDRSKRYFTIIQYDDNILNDLKDLNILIFCQGGYGRYKDTCYCIPLNCQLKPPTTTTKDKKIFASFVGTIKGRHVIREKLADLLASEEDYVISETVGYDKFMEIMEASTFSLCPRGYGQTSFRIYEALSVGSIPVYVYDEPLIPFADKFNFNEIGILVHESDIDSIDSILKSKSKNEIEILTSNGSRVFKEYFTYPGCYSQILNILKNEI